MVERTNTGWVNVARSQSSEEENESKRQRQNNKTRKERHLSLDWVSLLTC